MLRTLRLCLAATTAVACSWMFASAAQASIEDGPGTQYLSTCDWYVTAIGYDGAGAYRVPSVGDDWNCALRQGDFDNDAVRILQVTLNYCYGYSGVVVDGDFGPVTENALEQVTGSRTYGPEQRYWMLHHPAPSQGEGASCSHVG